MVSKWNANIRPIFYNRDEFKNNINKVDNDLEKEWSSRILIENTPQCNIIMHYNVFNEGFSYYSDQSGISYTILNAIAMKYVLTFRCRDFFIDEKMIPDDQSSPFIEYIREDERIENEKKKKNIDFLTKNTYSTNCLPFAKLKTREKVGSISINTASNEIVISKNKFICKGKIQDCNVLQKLKIKNIKREKQQLDKCFTSYMEYKNYMENKKGQIRT